MKVVRDFFIGSGGDDLLYELSSPKYVFQIIVYLFSSSSLNTFNVLPL